MKTDVDTCLKDIADWYVKNRRSLIDSEFRFIVSKHCENEAETEKFVKFLDSKPGQVRFKTLLRERKETPSTLGMSKSQKDEGWVYAKVGITEVRGRRVPTGIDIEQVSPSFNQDDFDKAVRIIEEKLKGEIPSYLKEPWQMTLEEYAYEEAHRLGEAKPRIDWVKAGYGQHYRDHKASVKYALLKGKPVPAEVLKDYPELTKLIPKAEASNPTLITEEQLLKVREPIPFTPTKRLMRDDVLYVVEEDIPHPIYGYSKYHKEYSVIDLRGYRKGYEPKLDILGIYTPNLSDTFRLQTGKLPPYQPTATGDKLLEEMRRIGVHKAYRIGR